MTLTVDIVRPLGEGKVQVDAKNKFLGFGKEIVSHYMVPEEKADEFIVDYKKETTNRVLSGMVAGVVTGGMFLMGAAASRKAGVILKAASMILFTAAGLIGSVIGLGMNNAKRMNKLFEKHDAAPMIFLKNEDVAKSEKTGEENKPEKTPENK